MRVIIALLAMLVIFIQCNSDQEIAQWRGPERNGIYPEKNLLTQWPDSGPKLLWRFDSLGVGYSSAAVTTEKVYTIGTVDSISYVFTFDMEGKLLWKKSLGKDWMVNWPGIRATPIIYDGLGYVLNGYGILFCFDAENGDLIWSRDIAKEFKMSLPEYGLCENLVVDGDKLFYTPASIDADIIALKRKTGDLIWKTMGSNDSTSYTSPILIEIANKKYLITQTAKALISVDVQSGKLVWKYDLKGSPLPNTPVYKDGLLYAVDKWKSGSFMLRIAEDGLSFKEHWRDSTFWQQQGDVIVLGERMYGASNDGRKFSCVDWNSGKEIYSDSTRAQIINVISANNLLYCYELYGIVKLLKPTDRGFENLGKFRIKGGSRLHCSHPVIKDGRLYIRHDNSLFVYDISAS